MTIYCHNDWGKGDTTGSELGKPKMLNTSYVEKNDTLVERY